MLSVAGRSHLSIFAKKVFKKKFTHYLPVMVPNELKGVDLSYMSASQYFPMHQFVLPPTSLV